MDLHALPAGLRRAAVTGLVLALVLGVWLAPAEAEDEGATTITVRVQEYVRRLTSLRRSEDVYRIHEEIWLAPGLSREIREADAAASLQARLVKSIGTLSRHQDTRIRKVALEALGAMGHVDGAKYLKPYLKHIREKPADPVTLAAIDAAGGIPEESLVAPLLKFVEDCPCPLAMRHAVEALGSYGKVESKREEILVALLEATLEEENFERWQVLAHAVPASLDRLTGREVSTLDAWLELIDANRADLGVLFPRDAEPAGA